MRLILCLCGGLVTWSLVPGPRPDAFPQAWCHGWISAQTARLPVRFVRLSWLYNTVSFYVPSWGRWFCRESPMTLIVCTCRSLSSLPGHQNNTTNGSIFRFTSPMVGIFILLVCLDALIMPWMEAARQKSSHCQNWGWCLVDAEFSSQTER